MPSEWNIYLYLIIYIIFIFQFVEVIKILSPYKEKHGKEKIYILLKEICKK